MKQSKIRGYIKNLENQNKRFSFDKTMRLLDVTNYVFLETINKYNYNDILKYNNSKYLFKEISNEFNIVYNMFENENVLPGVCLLRNIYEEILYIMAISLNIELEIDVKTRATYFEKRVCEHFDVLLGESYKVEDIDELYTYLSIISHVTNVKEALSHLIANGKTKKYIINEMKYMTILIEKLYIDFLDKKLSRKNDFCDNLMYASSYAEMINTIYYAAYSDNNDKVMKQFFYGEKNQKYLNDQQDKMIVEFNDFKINKNNIVKSIKVVLKELLKQINNSSCKDQINAIMEGNK